MFSEQQSNLVNQVDQAFKASPMDFWMQMTQKNLENLQQMQEQFFNSSRQKDPKD